jgi:hypothetical protein
LPPSQTYILREESTALKVEIKALTLKLSCRLKKVANINVFNVNTHVGVCVCCGTLWLVGRYRRCLYRAHPLYNTCQSHRLGQLVYVYTDERCMACTRNVGTIRTPIDFKSYPSSHSDIDLV